VVAPIGNTVPLAFEYVITGFAVTLSVAVAAEYATAAPLELVADTVRFEGKVNTGAVVSLTVTVNVPLLELFAPSVAVTVTVVVPSGKTVPLAFEYVITGLAVTLSIAVAAEYVTVAPFALVAVVVTLAGNVVNTGAVVSTKPTLDTAEPSPRTTRNPKSLYELLRRLGPRSAQRNVFALYVQAPPRSTPFAPVVPPLGSFPPEYVPYQSQHHCQTFPTISYNP
jgi:hypothetical protein